MNIVDPILAQCRFQPDAPALCAPGEPHATIAYGQLGKLINNVARHTERLGLRRGDTVVLYVQDMIGHAVLILGLAKATPAPRRAILPTRPIGMVRTSVAQL